MPRCVSHSAQACTHAWQPMQRLGIDEELVAEHRWHAILAATAAARAGAGVGPARGLAPCATPARRTTLYSGILLTRVERAVRQLVGALVARPSGTG